MRFTTQTQAPIPPEFVERLARAVTKRIDRSNEPEDLSDSDAGEPESKAATGPAQFSLRRGNLASLSGNSHNVLRPCAATFKRGATAISESVAATCTTCPRDKRRVAISRGAGGEGLHSDRHVADEEEKKSVRVEPESRLDRTQTHWRTVAETDSARDETVKTTHNTHTF